MKAIHINLKETEGLSMRTAAQLVGLARRLRSHIVIRLGSQVADARSLMSIMILCVNLPSPVRIEASGVDEREAIQAVAAGFNGGTPKG